MTNLFIHCNISFCHHETNIPSGFRRNVVIRILSFAISFINGVCNLLYWSSHLFRKRIHYCLGQCSLMMMMFLCGRILSTTIIDLIGMCSATTPNAVLARNDWISTAMAMAQMGGSCRAIVFFVTIIRVFSIAIGKCVESRCMEREVAVDIATVLGYLASPT